MSEGRTNEARVAQLTTAGLLAIMLARKTDLSRTTFVQHAGIVGLSFCVAYTVAVGAVFLIRPGALKKREMDEGNAALLIGAGSEQYR